MRTRRKSEGTTRKKEEREKRKEANERKEVGATIWRGRDQLGRLNDREQLKELHQTDCTSLNRNRFDTPAVKSLRESNDFGNIKWKNKSP